MPIRFLLPIVLNLLLVASCGGGGSDSSGTPPVQTPPPPPASDYLPVTGTVFAPTGVAADSLTVVSLGRESAIDGQGAYSAEVHPDAVSLMIATQAGRLFALARIVVADSGFTADAVRIDTTSTAVSMVFVSPFIMTQDPVEAASLLALIQNDVAIPALAQAIDEAFNDANPFQNTNFRDALRNALDSVASQLTAVAAAPSRPQKANAASQVSLLRLPKRSGVQILAAQQAEATPIAIDTEHTDINVATSGDQYFLQPTSSILNSIDWFVEVGEIDVSGFQYTHQLEPMLADLYTVYPRVGPNDEPVGIDINSAQGFYRWLEFVSMGLNWLVDHIQNRISPDGIAVSQVVDGLYVVRSFSGGTAGSSTEYDFVQEEVPNGALNHRRARIINHLSAAMDVLGIAIDLLPAIDDTIANECLRGSLIDVYTDTSVSIEITNSVVSEVLTVTDIAQDLMIDFGVCVVGRAGITSATGLGWLNDVWDVITGLAGAPVTGAQLAERYTFMFVRATPLESMLIQVGSPIIDDTEPPTIPVTFTATPTSTTEIQLQWSESTDNDDVAEYVLYRDNEIIGSTDTLSLQDSSLTISTTYCYEIEAFDFVGNSSGRSSPPVCATTLSVPDTTPPTVPQNVAANVISDTAIDISWSPSSDDRGVSEYVVYRDEQPINTISETTTSDTGLMAGSQYCYTVVAYDAAGNSSDPSSPPTCATTRVMPDTTAPTAPTGIVATAISDIEINVTWNESSDDVGVTGYRVIRDTVPVDTTTGLDYLDSPLGASTTYCYTVSAYDAAGNESLPSTTSACATTMATPDTMPPSTPTGLTATAESASQIGLSWDAATDNVGVTGYNIYRDSVLLEAMTTLTFADTALAASTQYCYTVTAVDAAENESPLSVEICTTTSASNSFSFVLTRQVDTTTPIPGQAGQFTSFQEVELTASGFAFRSGGAFSYPLSDSTGVYQFDGTTVSLVADETTTIPNSSEQFTSFGDLSADGENVYFLGNKNFTSWTGVYGLAPSGLNTVADQQSAVPGRTEPWSGFLAVKANGAEVTFTTFDQSGNFGIYQSLNNTIQLIADLSDPLAGLGVVLNNVGNRPDDIDSSPGRVAFFGTYFEDGADHKGIYIHENDQVSRVVEFDTMLPGDVRNAGYLTDDGSEIGFHFVTQQPDRLYEYIYRSTAMGLEALIGGDIDSVTDDPLSRDFGPISYPIVKGGNVLFEAYEGHDNGTKRGIYLRYGESVSRVAITTELLDGNELQYVWMGDFDGTRLAFIAEFLDGSKAIYTGTITAN